jgi:uncharacterized membrane protein HdeD (DUF308 family)
MLVNHPAAGLMTVIWFVSAWAIATGIIKIMLAFEARSFAGKVENWKPSPAT